MFISGINVSLDAQSAKNTSLKKQNSNYSIQNQQELLSQTASQSISNINKVNFGALRKTTPITHISFAGNPDKHSDEYLHVIAEMAPLAKTGGAAVVAEDLGHMFPNYNNSKHAFFLPYYNGEELTDPTGYTIGHKIREDEEGPYYQKLGSNDKIHLEKIAQKDIHWGQDSALYDTTDEVALYKVKRDEMDKMGFPKNTSVYFVYTPLCSSMEKEYSGAYNDGNLGNIYSQFSKAATELAPELAKAENGNFNPENILCHDWHTSYFLNYANTENQNGNDYYSGIKPGYVIHNLGRAYQGVTSPYGLFCQVASPEEIKAINQDPEFQNLMMEQYRSSAQPLKHRQNVEFEINNYFKNIMPELYDEKGAFNASMIPIRLAERGWVTIHTVSGNYADELTNTPELSEGLTNHVKKLKQKGKMIGITNGMSTPSCDPSSTKGYPVPYNQIFKTFKPTDNISDIRAAKLYNKQKLFEKLVPDETGALDASQIMPRFNPDKNKIIGHLDKQILDNPDIPLFVGWGRGDYQKGLDITLEAIEKYTDENPQSKAVFIIGGGVTGAGEEGEKIEKQAKELANGKLKGRLIFMDGFAPAYALASAADYALFTSRFEPCGLTQFEAMKYGCIPIVTSTGGFASTVLQSDETDTPTGYKTEHSFFMTDETLRNNLNITGEITDKNRRTLRDTALAEEVKNAMERATLTTLSSKEEHEKIMRNCLTAKAGWDNNAQFNDGTPAVEKIDNFHFNHDNRIEPNRTFINHR